MKHLLTRRHFIQQGAVVSAGLAATPVFGDANVASALPRHVPHFLGNVIQVDETITRDPRVKKLLKHSIDAAIAAGASYTDMRLTHTRRRDFSVVTTNSGDGHSLPLTETEEITIGIRACVRGYWGFASGPVWTMDEGARLGKEAVHQATTNALGKDRAMILAPKAKVVDGDWIMPVKIDPFSMHPSQVEDILHGVGDYVSWQPGAKFKSCNIQASFQRQDKAFCASDGSYCIQRTYRSSGQCIVIFDSSSFQLNNLTPAGVGFEMFDEMKLRQEIDESIREMKEIAALPVVPIDVGRYDTVFDAASVANLLSETIGVATELDRALGFEANAGGTSYLNDPAAMRDKHVIGSQLLSVAVNRSAPGGAATVQWDDEGVVPQTTALITEGVLSGYQTTREGAGWLSSVASGRVTSSSGGAYAPLGVEAPLTHTGNLHMGAAADTKDFNNLIASVKKGVACQGFSFSVDFQQLNGVGGELGRMFEVVNGKKVARIVGGSLLFRTPELWKSLRVIGGDTSRETFGKSVTKGEPPQISYHTVSAVPAMFEGLTFIDATRKA